VRKRDWIGATKQKGTRGGVLLKSIQKDGKHATEKKMGWHSSDSA